MEKEVTQICHPCATAKGWTPLDKPVGIWPGICDCCGKQANLCAPRDYYRPEEPKLTLKEELAALYSAILEKPKD